jgi:hypothetical protein
MVTGTDDGDERFSIKTMTLDGQKVDVVVSGKNEISSFYYNREEQRSVLNVNVARSCLCNTVLIAFKYFVIFLQDFNINYSTAYYFAFFFP